MIYGLASGIITFIGIVLAERRGVKRGRHEIETVAGEMVPGGAVMVAFIAAVERTRHDDQLGHTLNGSFHLHPDDTHYQAFTIEHPTSCNPKRCPTTKAVARYGPVAHVRR